MKKMANRLLVVWILVIVTVCAISLLTSCGNKAADNPVSTSKGELETPPENVCNHGFVKIEAVSATCTEPGLTEGKKCSLCDYVEIAQEEIPALGHKEEKSEAKEATCIEEGLTEGKKCSVCDEILVEQEIIPALHLDYIETIEKGMAATCTETGLTDRKHCTECDLYFQEEIPTPGKHTIVISEAIAPTCNEEGHTEGRACAYCDYVEKEQEVIPAIHPEAIVVSESGYAPTCTETGLTDEKYCNICNAVVSVHQEIPATGHTEELIEKVDATCNETGLMAGIKCSICDFIIFEQNTLSARHAEAIVVTKEGYPATCTETGLTDEKYCKICEKTVEYQEEIPVVHINTAVSKTGYVATCIKNGLTDEISCADCGVIIAAQEIIPAIGHTEVTLEAVEATCKKVGLAEGKKCSVCNEIIVEQTETPIKTEHSEIIIEAVLPTCESTGLTEGKKCGWCNEIIQEQEIIEKLEHKIIDLEAIEATCIAPGLTAGKACELCGYIEVEQEEIAIEGEHKIEITYAGYPATCLEPGMTAEKCCTICNKIVVPTSFIPAVGHNPVVVDTKAPTCAEEGHYKYEKCFACEEILTSKIVFSALGHYSKKHLENVDPTCTTIGLTSGVQCKMCGTPIKEQELIHLLCQIDPEGFCELCESMVISSKEQLIYFAELVNGGNDFNGKVIILGNDIDLEGMEWTPIGMDSDTSFRGVFEGNGYKISGFKITVGRAYNGLFGCIDGEIRNLGAIDYVIDYEYDGYTYVGGLVALTRGNEGCGKITGCYAKGSINVTSSDSSIRVGGLVGKSYFSAISNSYAVVDISASGKSYVYVGGLIGETYGLTNCYAISSIKAVSYEESACVGGLVGENRYNSIFACFAVSKIEASSESSNMYHQAYSGYISGKNSSGSVSNSYSYVIGDIANKDGAEKEESELKKVYLQAILLNFSPLVWNFAEGFYPVLK